LAQVELLKQAAKRAVLFIFAQEHSSCVRL